MQPITSRPALEHNVDSRDRKRQKRNRACDLCRRKKTRCDHDPAYPNIACSSCRNYEKECTFSEPTKKRGPSKGYVEGLEGRLKRVEELLVNMLQDMPPDEIADVTAELEKDSDAYKKSSEENKDAYFFAGSSSGYYLLSRLFPQDQSHPLNQMFPKPINNNDDLIIKRPSELRSSSSGNNQDWKLPPKGLMDYLLNVYFERLNKFLPILDKDEFYKLYEREGSQSSQVIPIALTTCCKVIKMLDKNHPIFAEYGVEKEALKKDLTFQLHLHHLPDFLEPKVQSIQLLLLNAAHSESWLTQGEAWLSVSIAIKMAQDLGLHRASFQPQGLSKAELEARKRLWWSAYILDRCVCAAVARPLTISDADCDIDYPESPDHFHYFAKLSSIHGESIRTLRSPKIQVLPDKSQRIENICRFIQQKLVEWKNNLPSHLQISDEEFDQISQSDSINPALKEKLENGAGQLYFAYTAVHLSVNKYLFSTNIDQSSVASTCQELIRKAFYTLSYINVELLLSFWCFSSYFLTEILTIIFINCKNPDPTIASEAKYYNEKLKGFYRHLEETLEQPSLVPYIDLIFKLGSGSLEDKEKDNSQGTLGDEFLHQTSLINNINGLEWSEIAKLLFEIDQGPDGTKFM